MAHKLYSSWFCPFAQRAWIALVEKGIPFEYIEIDPSNKKPEFLALNPTGLVPAITLGNKCVHESTVCIQYVDELEDNGKLLLPKDPYQRARVRIWSEFVGKNVVPLFYKILKKDKSELETAKAEMLNNLSLFTKELDVNGPYFTGKDLGMADIMICPFTLRLAVLKHFKDFQVPETTEFKRFHQWMDAVHSHQSVLQTYPGLEKLIGNYEPDVKI